MKKNGFFIRFLLFLGFCNPLIYSSYVDNSQIAIRRMSSQLIESGIDLSLYKIEDRSSYLLWPLIWSGLRAAPRRSLDVVDVFPVISRGLLIGFVDGLLDSIGTVLFNIAEIGAEQASDLFAEMIANIVVSSLAFVQTNMIYAETAIGNPLNFAGRDKILRLCELDGSFRAHEKSNNKTRAGFSRPVPPTGARLCTRVYYGFSSDRNSLRKLSK